jgi:mono/diheme cytochrome c family protein
MPNGNSPIKRLCFADGEWKNGGTLQDIQRVITEGVAATQMRPFREKLSAEEIDVVSRYVKSLEAADP